MASRFLPPRASPQPKPRSLAQDTSRSSIVSAPELLGLVQHEIDFLDRVMERAGPSATTFLSVFKAYNDVLAERGLNPQNEVVYYAKLLKLGTLKGQNWAHKWNAIKHMNGYDQEGGASNVHRGGTKPGSSKVPSKSITTRLTPDIYAPRHELDSDTFTLHSHEEGDRTEMPAPGALDNLLMAPRSAPINGFSQPSRLSNNTLGLETETTESAALGTRPAPSTMAKPVYAAALYDMQGAGPSTAIHRNQHDPFRVPRFRPDPTPPSQPFTPRQGVRPPSRQAAPIESNILAPTGAHDMVAQARQRKGHIINEEDAWIKIKQARDEEDAAQFRGYKLLERSWNVWRQGHEWIITTHEQIARARDNLILRLALQRWLSKLSAHRDLSRRVGELANRRHLRLAMRVWAERLRERQQLAWRADMRKRMKMVRDKRDTEIRRETWMVWRRAWLSRVAERLNERRILKRTLTRWRLQVQNVRVMEDRADDWTEGREVVILSHAWHVWKSTTDLKAKERLVAARVDLNTARKAIMVWKSRMHDIQKANAFRNVVCISMTLRSWKAARDRIRAYERKADKHLARQDDVLVYAIMRVWKAHERGKLLQRVRAARLLKQTWSTWKKRLRANVALDDKALAFSRRAKSSLASSALVVWHQNLIKHRNGSTFATQYHSAHLLFQCMQKWRLMLRARLRSIKQAKKAARMMVVRGAWRQWRTVLEERRRERLMKEVETRKLQKCFQGWHKKAQTRSYMKLSEQQVQTRIASRLLRTSLSHWLDRVVELKSREIDIAVTRDRALVSNAFTQWKAICVRHVEELSLMESYQHVKREEMIRRMFHHWLSSAREVRRRRVTLRQKEDEARLATLSSAWNQWRGRYKNEQLRPIEHEVIVRTKDNILFRAFGIWHAKTTSLPAIHFHASHVKGKTWQKWRDAMPRAFQAKAARDMHSRIVISKTLAKWLEAHRTKVQLKAIARARYLRLPTAAPRLSPSTLARSTTPISSSRALRERVDDESAPSRATRQTTPFSARPGFTSLLSASRASRGEDPIREATPSSISRARLDLRDTSPVRSKSSFGFTRETSPTRVQRPSSSVGGDGSRSKLWIELQEVQKKSQSRSRASTIRTLDSSPRHDPT